MRSPVELLHTPAPTSAEHLTTTGQPDIAIDLQPNGDRYSGWATVVLPDGTGVGHVGATAEAWLETP